MKIFLGLGTNLGELLLNLQNALNALKEAGIKIQKKSSVYETSPKENADQTRFLNMALEIQTGFSPEELLIKLKKIESQFGRVRAAKRYMPRPIDIDILYYGDKIIDSKVLKVPHPKIPERKFVLVPLNEISPDFADPRSGKTVNLLLNECNDDGTVGLFL